MFIWVHTLTHGASHLKTIQTHQESLASGKCIFFYAHELYEFYLTYH